MAETYALELRHCLADCFEDITLPYLLPTPTIQQILIDLQFCVSIAFGAKETTVKN